MKKRRIITVFVPVVLLTATAVLILGVEGNDMGLFDRLRAMFSKHSRARVSDAAVEGDSAQNGHPETIEVYDEYGRRFLVPREEWRSKILPDNLQGKWNDPDGLYSMIVSAINDGFSQDVREASVRLMEIDPDPERSRVVRAIVLMKTGDVAGAEGVLERYIEEHGPTGIVLTNLAKVFAERGQNSKAETTLWQALKLDPNQDNGLLWWATIHKERFGEEGFVRAMRQAADIDGSWRPQLWLARRSLERKDLPEAKRLYEHVLGVASGEPEVLMMISGDLGKHGYVSEILSVVRPIYDPQKHDIRCGMNILQAYLEEGNYLEGEKVLDQLFALHRLDMKTHLMRYAGEFDKLRQAAEKQPPVGEQPLQVTAVRIDRPIWYYGLNDPKWLLPPKDDQKDIVAFLVLANTTPSDQKEPGAQREDEMGRLTRSIPLYLAESVFFWTEKRPIVVIPVVIGHGPAVSGTEWSSEQLFQFADGAAGRIVTGCVRAANGRLEFKLTVWDTKTKDLLKRLERSARRGRESEAVLALEQDLLDVIAPGHAKSSSRGASFYVRPNATQMPHYLASLAQTLMMTLVHNKHVPREGLWGERNMFEWYLGTALEIEGAQVPRILFLASLNKGRAYGSQVFREYKQQALKLLEDEESKDSEFYRLSPLLFKLLEMDREYGERKAELLSGADPAYRQWIEGLEKME